VLSASVGFVVAVGRWCVSSAVCHLRHAGWVRQQTAGRSCLWTVGLPRHCLQIT